MSHLMKRLITALVAVIVAIAWAGAATAGAQTQEDADFSGGTHDGTEAIPPGNLALSPVTDVVADFDGTTLPSGWETVPWETGGSATVADGLLTVNGARANTTSLYDAGRLLDFAATFTADPFQHVGFGNTFDDAPWAMFSTGGGALPVGLYARTLAPGGTQVNTPIADVDPLEEHQYSIEWTPTEVVYFVDGVEVAVHEIASSAQMRPIVSDFSAGGGSVIVEYLYLDPVPDAYPAQGTFTSRIFDAGDDRATWRTLTAVVDTPEGTGVSFEVRTGTTPAPDAAWTDWQPVGAAGALPGPAERRYLQYRATLTTTNTAVTPFVESVTLAYDVDTSAPAVVIGDVTVSGTTARVTFSSAATDLARFECSLDGGTFQTCTSPREYTALSGGSHSVRVRAVDQAGNVGTPAEITFVIDDTAPGATIGGVTVSGTTATVTFSSTATDVARFECSLDNGAFQTCTSPRQITGLSDGSHTIRVRAIDQTGNVGTPAESTFVIDTTAPAATIAAVAVTGDTARVTFSSEQGATFQCNLDGGPFSACTSPREYTGLSDGSHTVRVRATDQAGNTGTAAERTFTIDTTAPAVTIGDVTVSGTTARVTFSSEAGARFECLLDNGPFQACTSPREYTGLSAGSHTIRVRAIDQAGNVGVTAERSFLVDTSGPAVLLGDVAVSGTTARVTFSSEAGARFECSLDNGPFVACTSPREYTGLTSGSHTVRVRAIDQAGNAGAAVERSFVIDTTAPVATIGDVTVAGTTARVAFSSEAGATFQCSLDNGPFVACTSPREYTGLTSGSHTIRVRAIDQAGNVGVSAERSFVIASPPPPVPTPDTSAPKVRPKPKSVHVSNKGKFKVSLRCPSNEIRCRIVIKIRYRGATLTSKAVTVLGGSSKAVALRLKPSARIAIRSQGRLRVTAVTTARDAAGNAATTHTRLKLRA